MRSDVVSDGNSVTFLFLHFIYPDLNSYHIIFVLIFNSCLNGRRASYSLQVGLGRELKFERDNKLKSFFFDLSLFTFSKHDSKARYIITFAKFKRKIQLLFSGMHDKKLFLQFLWILINYSIVQAKTKKVRFCHI